MVKNSTIRKVLGPKETEVIARLTYEKLSVVTVEQFDRLFGFDTGLRKQLFFRLKKKKILAPITRGVYFFSPLESGPFGRRMNEYLVPPILFPQGNYYIGYSTLYNYYGFTDQIFQTIYILNTSRQRRRIIGGVEFKLTLVSPKRMYGLEKIDVRGSEIIVSNRERTLVDLFYFPDPVGGLKSAFEILKSQVKARKVDAKKLIKYALRFPSISTRKRIGYVLEKCGVSDKALKPLMRSMVKSSLWPLYGSKSRKGVIDKKWKLIIDDTQR